MYLRWEARKDRSYNVFDKADLSNAEKRACRAWDFVIPKTIAAQVTQDYRDNGNDIELVVTFAQEGNKMMMLKSDERIPPVSRFKYFEIEILENQAGSDIWVGVLENKDTFIETPNNIGDLNGSTT